MRRVSLFILVCKAEKLVNDTDLNFYFTSRQYMYIYFKSKEIWGMAGAGELVQIIRRKRNYLCSCE